MINALNLLTSFPNLQVADRQQPQAYPGTLDDLKFVWFTRYLRVLHLLQCKNNSNLGVNQYNLPTRARFPATDRKVASSICNVSTQRKVSNIGLKVCNDQVCRLCRICRICRICMLWRIGIKSLQWSSVRPKRIRSPSFPRLEASLSPVLHKVNLWSWLTS